MVLSVYRFLYHASQTEQTKKAVYDEFSKTSSKIWCLISTFAFGMVCIIASYQSSITALFVLQAMIGAVEDWEMSLDMYAWWHHTYHACLLLNL